MPGKAQPVFEGAALTSEQKGILAPRAGRRFHDVPRGRQQCHVAPENHTHAQILLLRGYIWV